MKSMDAFAAHLVASGLGVIGTSIFMGNDNQLPALTDAQNWQIIINETGGPEPQGTHNEGFAVLRRPSFQIVARAKRYNVAADKIEAAFLACRVVNQTIGGVFWLSIKPMSDPFKLPPDANGNSRVGVNISTHRRV